MSTGIHTIGLGGGGTVHRRTVTYRPGGSGLGIWPVAADRLPDVSKICQLTHNGGRRRRRGLGVHECDRGLGRPTEAGLPGMAVTGWPMKADQVPGRPVTPPKKRLAILRRRVRIGTGGLALRVGPVIGGRLGPVVPAVTVVAAVFPAPMARPDLVDRRLRPARRPGRSEGHGMVHPRHRGRCHERHPDR